MEIIEPRVEAGDKDALGVLGMAYLFGMGREADGERAVGLCTESASAGQPKGMHCLGHAHSFGSGGLDRDHVQANYWWSKAVEQEDLESMTHLADNYLTGRGVELDPLEGVRLLRRAADGGERYAAYQLGEMHGLGLLVERSEGLKRSYWERALEGGVRSPDLLLWLGSAYLREGVDDELMGLGLNLILEAVEDGYPAAELLMGYMCLTGTHVEQDLDCAERMYTETKQIYVRARIGLWITNLAQAVSGAGPEGA